MTAVLSLLLASQSLIAQQREVITEPGGEIIIKGPISRMEVEKDSLFKSWFVQSLRGYKPNADAVTALKQQADSVSFYVFMGTWCEDSHFVIPKFFSLADAAGFNSGKISIVGLDRNKKSTDNITETMKVTNVPTIIVMKNGKELGRVVEYGKSGYFDKDLGEVLTVQ